jgi:N-glycosylase/DNA lyase
MNSPALQKEFPVRHYDLAATLNSGQAFRWTTRDGGWEGVLGTRWVRLEQQNETIVARVAEPVSDWRWLIDYLQLEVDLAQVLDTFPNDSPMQAALAACSGLRLLRQEPWECLASFILSSTKQIIQIRQIISILCRRFGETITPPEAEPVFTFPTAERIAQSAEAALRACKMGFRAPYLLAAARMVVANEINLETLGELKTPEARFELEKIPGVGRKIADCVLLFAYGFQDAFPVDVWVMKALRQLYFPRGRPKIKKLRHFSETHFGPNAGYAQQYLFHYMRTQHKRIADRSPAP